MSILNVSFPKDFDEKYEKFSDMLSDILKVKDPPIFGDTNTENQFEVIEDIVKKGDEKEKLKAEIKNEIKTEGQQDDPTKTKPHTLVKNGIGYFKFYKEGENIKIGKEKTRQFKLLQSLTEPNFGIQKTIEAVFEAIKQPQDDNDSRLSGLSSPETKTRMLEIIEYTKKELQKIKGLQKKINYCMDAKKQKMWLK